MKKIISIFGLLLIVFSVAGQKISEKDKATFETYKSRIQNKNLETGDFIVESAKQFLGVPYVASTLEVGNKEELTINFDKFDCTTFVETLYAFAMAKSNLTLNNVGTHLTGLRYRNGILTDYTSRLHYFSDWINNNVRRGYLTDISKEIGEPIKFNVGFMSANSNQYKHLKANPGFISIIKQQEQSINKMHHYYIPKNKLQAVKKSIKNGDIVAIVTSAKGLDVAHLGVAYWHKNDLHFIHASSNKKYMKVIINTETLQSYLNQANSRTGIMVLRPTF